MDKETLENLLNLTAIVNRILETNIIGSESTASKYSSDGIYDSRQPYFDESRRMAEKSKANEKELRRRFTNMGGSGI